MGLLVKPGQQKTSCHGSDVSHGSECDVLKKIGQKYNFLCAITQFGWREG